MNGINIFGRPFYTPPWEQLTGNITNQANEQANVSAANFNGSGPNNRPRMRNNWLWNLFGRPSWMANAGMVNPFEGAEFGQVQSANASPMGRAGIGKGAAPAYASDTAVNNPLKQNDRLFGLRDRPIIRGMGQFLGGYGSKTYRG